MTGEVEWQVSVSKDTDTEARDFLRSQGLHEAGLSTLVEDAIHMYLFQRTAHDIQGRNSLADPDALQALVDEAVREVRREMYLKRA